MHQTAVCYHSEKMLAIFEKKKEKNIK